MGGLPWCEVIMRAMRSLIPIRTGIFAGFSPMDPVPVGQAQIWKVRGRAAATNKTGFHICKSAQTAINTSGIYVSICF